MNNARTRGKETERYREIQRRDIVITSDTQLR